MCEILTLGEPMALFLANEEGPLEQIEKFTKLAAGADLIKVFPGELFGPGFIKAIEGPLPQARLMPTGGVSVDNVGEWIKAGCVAVGVGSNLTAGAKTGDYASITKEAEDFIEAIGLARA
jgi:2-dehydro-3-deoxyphosphogluconate aldolase/(4S)-4-hydroxy-2-oxoglutarate aldolase